MARLKPRWIQKNVTLPALAHMPCRGFVIWRDIYNGTPEYVREFPADFCIGVDYQFDNYVADGWIYTSRLEAELALAASGGDLVARAALKDLLAGADNV